jgi:hypothetical protein
MTGPNITDHLIIPAIFMLHSAITNKQPREELLNLFNSQTMGTNITDHLTPNHGKRYQTLVTLKPSELRFQNKEHPHRHRIFDTDRVHPYASIYQKQYSTKISLIYYTSISNLKTHPLNSKRIINY